MQDKYTSFLDYGIDNANFKPFRFMKAVKLGRFVSTDKYYKFVSTLYLFQVLLSILGFVLLFMFNYFDSLGILRIKL